MSVRLWWKFSPYLMTPLPMIATWPPSPILASPSRAPPAYRPGWTRRNPLAQARDEDGATGEHQKTGDAERDVWPGVFHVDGERGQQREQRVVDDVTGDGRQRAACALGDEAEPETEHERQRPVHPLEVKQRETQTGHDDRAGSGQMIATRPLQIHAAEHFLRRARHAPDPQ